MKRYPGIRPFRTDEKGLFFGRDNDIERLYRLIDLEQLVILYGKSGYGKSSLLSAGIFPRLQDEGRRRFWEIRFGPYQPGEKSPADAVKQVIQRQTRSDSAAWGEPSIWQALKTLQNEAKNTPQDRFLLVFDQFEELFSYPPEQILEFKKQLAEALYARMPKRYETMLAAAKLTPEQEDAVYKPFDLKVVFSIRSDRMSLLNGLKDYLPNLLQHVYELEALDDSAAKQAVCAPAALAHPPNTEENFDVPAFAYSPGALDAIFTALRNERGRIETSALQIVCRYVEDNVAGVPNQKIEPAQLGDIKNIFRAFYERTIANLPLEQQKPARYIVEELLIKDGVRIPYAAQALLGLKEYPVTQNLLDQLSAASLLRVERDEQGRMLYEVGHDTLVTPISEAALARKAEEEKIRLQEEADKQRKEKEKAVAERRRARLVAAGAILLALVAVAALAWAMWQQSKLRETTGKVVESILDDANELIRHLQYDDAWNKMSDACQLGEMKEKTAKTLMEIAFFFNETGSLDKAITATQQAAGMFEKSGLATELNSIDKNNKEEARKRISNILKQLDSNVFAILEARYFPVMLDVPAGTFWMGCDTVRDKNWNSDELPRHQVNLSSYKLAQTETTFWQFGMFAAAKGKKITDFAPSWGIDGDNPAVNVSWFDACQYANWLCQRNGRDTIYVFGEKGEDMFGRITFPITLNSKSYSAYRLPTEAEWEYAARGGGHLKESRYAGSDSLDLVGWFVYNSDVNGVNRSHPVRMKQPNAGGFYDMSGNVWEWCWDWYGDYPRTVSDSPHGPEKGTYRVNRGGGWGLGARGCRTARRGYWLPDDRNNGLGFRLALSLQ